MQEYINAFKKCFVIEGRASRRDYWMFILFNFIFFIALIILSKIISLIYLGLGILILLIPWFLYCFIVIIPSFTLTIRRFHDINKSGLWFLINFIPIVGGVWLLVLMLKKGDLSDNQYGPVPIKTTSNYKKITKKIIKITIIILFIVFIMNAFIKGSKPDVVVQRLILIENEVSFDETPYLDVCNSDFVVMTKQEIDDRGGKSKCFNNGDGYVVTAKKDKRGYFCVDSNHGRKNISAKQYNLINQDNVKCPL